MIKIECDDKNSAVNISAKGARCDIGIEFYKIFESLLSTKELDLEFKHSLFAYLETDEELLNEFLKYHNSDFCKQLNDIVNKIFGDNDK